MRWKPPIRTPATSKHRSQSQLFKTTPPQTHYSLHCQCCQNVHLKSVRILSTSGCKNHTFILAFPDRCSSRDSCCFQRAVLFPCFMGQAQHLHIRGTYTSLRTTPINLPRCSAGKGLVLGSVKTYTRWWLQQVQQIPHSGNAVLYFKQYTHVLSGQPTA